MKLKLKIEEYEQLKERVYLADVMIIEYNRLNNIMSNPVKLIVETENGGNVFKEELDNEMLVVLRDYCFNKIKEFNEEKHKTEAKITSLYEEEI